MDKSPYEPLRLPRPPVVIPATDPRVAEVTRLQAMTLLVVQPHLDQFGALGGAPTAAELNKQVLAGTRCRSIRLHRLLGRSGRSIRRPGGAAAELAGVVGVAGAKLGQRDGGVRAP